MITTKIQATHKELTGYYVSVLFTDTGFSMVKNFRFDSEKQIEDDLQKRIDRGIINTQDAINERVANEVITTTQEKTWEEKDGKIICYEKGKEYASVDVKSISVKEVI